MYAIRTRLAALAAAVDTLATMTLCAMFAGHRPVSAGREARCAMCGIRL